MLGWRNSPGAAGRRRSKASCWLRSQGSRHLGILYFCWRCSHTATEPSTRTRSPGDAGSRLGAPVDVMSHSDEGPRPDLLNTSAISAVSGSFTRCGGLRC